MSNVAKSPHRPIGSMYGIYANIWGILMVNVTIYSIHGSSWILWVHEGFNGKTMGNSSVQFDYRRAMRCNETQWDCHGLLNELRGNSGRGATGGNPLCEKGLMKPTFFSVRCLVFPGL